MATTLQTASEQATKSLINYRVDGGVAVIEMNDPPANTYTYEMNRQLDDAILRARMDNDVHVILLTGAGDKFFRRARTSGCWPASIRLSNITFACTLMKLCCGLSTPQSW